MHSDDLGLTVSGWTVAAMEVDPEYRAVTFLQRSNQVADIYAEFRGVVRVGKVTLNGVALMLQRKIDGFWINQRG